VLHASNQGLPAVHLDGTDVAESYKDIVSRFLGEEKALRFTDYQKPGLLQRIFGTK
jgi:septum site-determining protein MinD